MALDGQSTIPLYRATIGQAVLPESTENSVAGPFTKAAVGADAANWRFV